MTRMILTGAAACILSGILGKLLLPLLRALKAGQSVRSIGPTWHNIKAGTPLMGGLMFIGAALFCLLGNLPSTVTCLMSFVLAVWLTSFFWIGFPVFFGLAAFASSYVLRGVLKRYMPEHEEDEEDEEEEEVSDEEEL